MKHASQSIMYYVLCIMGLCLLTSCFLLLTSIPVFAQTASSVVVKVGNPPESTALAKAADDLFSAYKICSTGDTHERYASLTIKFCLINNLKDKYSSSISDFDARYGNTLGSGVVVLNNLESPALYCVQCLGYVALAASLISGKNGKGEVDTFTAGAPASYLKSNQIPAGKVVFEAFDPKSTTIKPGDVGITTSTEGGEVFDPNIGHILIVESFDPRSDVFAGNESSWPEPPYCVATNNSKHPVSRYHFYRLRK